MASEGRPEEVCRSFNASGNPSGGAARPHLRRPHPGARQGVIREDRVECTEVCVQSIDTLGAMTRELS